MMIDDTRLPDLLSQLVDHLSDVDDLSGLTEEETLRVITAAEQVKAAVTAVQARATTAFVGGRDADAAQARSRGDISAREAGRQRSTARAEVALARRCSPFQADRHVGHARAWCSDLPQTMAALTSGALSERRATIVAQESSCLSPRDRREVDARLAPEMTRLGDRALTAAVQRACIDVDQMSIVERRRRAAADRCVSVRPTPDGMARLTVLGPLVDVIGAYASLTAAESTRRVATGDPATDAALAADGRGRGAWLADTALERLSGRDDGRAQPVEVGLVMSDSALLPGQPGPSAHPGGGARSDASEHAEIPGWGAVPVADARDHLLRLLDGQATEGSDDGPARIWLRRLFTSPDGRDLVAMDSRRRFFTGALRSLIALRDPTCRIPWCDAPTREVDHADPAGNGGATSAANALGLCQRHNLTKESPGWQVDVTSTGLDPGGRPHEVRLTTPADEEYTSLAPPLLGHGRARAGPDIVESPLEAHYVRMLHDAA